MVAESHSTGGMFAAELRRSPLATVFTVIGGIAGTTSVFLTLSLTFMSSPAASPPLSTSSIHYVTGAMTSLGLSAFWASMSRVVHAFSSVASFFASILFASINILLCTIVLNTLCVGFPIGRPRAEVTAKLIYWMTAAVFLAFNAEQVGMGIGRSGTSSGKSVSDEDAWGTLSVMVVALLIWLGLLSSAHALIAGQANP